MKRELSSCDEDDRDSLEKDLEEAEEWLRKVDYWIGQVADALPPMKRANQNIHALVEKRLPCAARFLTEKLARFAEYARLAIPHEGVASQRMGAAMPSSTLANVAAADLAGHTHRGRLGAGHHPHALDRLAVGQPQQQLGRVRLHPMKLRWPRCCRCCSPPRSPSDANQTTLG